MTLSGRDLNERAARYRQMASNAEAAAGHCETEDLRSGWLRIARDWKTLAEATEQRLQEPDAHRPYGASHYVERFFEMPRAREA